MSTPMDSLLASRAEIDLNDLPVIRERVSLVDKIQRGELPEISQPVPAAVAPPPAPPPAPAPSDYMPASQMAAPAVQLPAPLPPQAQPTTVVPPVLPNDTPRVQDRINKLYAQKKTAEETVSRLEATIQAQNERIDALLRQSASSPPPQPQTFGSLPDPSAPAGFVSRAEMLQILNQQRLETDRRIQLGNAHIVSRAEAERDFPDVFADPQLKAAADQIWASDLALQRDPTGPYKAVALARGLHSPNPVAATARASVDVRKQMLSVGPTTPAGGGAPNPSQEERYSAALARAKVTQDPADFVRARLIAQGLG